MPKKEVIQSECGCGMREAISVFIVWAVIRVALYTQYVDYSILNILEFSRQVRENDKMATTITLNNNKQKHD